MLKDYALSLSLITLLLVGYTAILLTHKGDLRADLHNDVRAATTARTEITFKTPHAENAIDESSAPEIQN